MELELILADGQTLRVPSKQAHGIQRGCMVFQHPLLNVSGLALVAGQLKEVVGLEQEAAPEALFFLQTEDKIFALSRLPRLQKTEDGCDSLVA